MSFEKLQSLKKKKIKKIGCKVLHSFLHFSCINTEREMTNYLTALQDLELSQAECQPKTSCGGKKKKSQHAEMCKQEGHL